jgi:hypothetical protein
MKKADEKQREEELKKNPNIVEVEGSLRWTQKTSGRKSWSPN